MRTPKNLKQALSAGFRVTDQAERSNPESGNTRGKIRLVLDGMSKEGHLGQFEIVVPYKARYSFGRPRPARADERF